MPTKPTSFFGGAVNDVSHLPQDLTLEFFQLLEAVPFESIKGEISFTYPEIAAHRLRTPLSSLPATEQAWEDMLSPDGARQRKSAARRLNWDGAQYRIRYQCHLPTGQNIWIEECAQRLSGDGETAHHIQGVLRLIDRDKAQIDQAAYQARFDEMTGLMNSGSFEQSLIQTAALMHRQEDASTLIRLRLTNLKDVQSVYGFAAADHLVKMIAQRLRSLFDVPDLIARLSEADFGICLSAVNMDIAEGIIERLEMVLFDTPYATPYGILPAKFSMAVTALESLTSAALEQTDMSLNLHSKDDGWAVQICGADMDQDLRAAQAKPRADITEEDIIAGLNERRISLAYQPIIDAQSAEVHHYESLLRLRREDGAVVSAGGFIMAAERLGLVSLLDRRALELAAACLRDMPDVKLAINVSAQTVKGEAEIDAYIGALKALGADARRLTIELTETAAVDDPVLASLFSERTRSLGCEFAIDDFGAGYTTFQNLMAIEADCIKIDGSLIQGVASEPHKASFVRMMVDLAQTFSVKIVAEMVDNRADADLLRRLGVDYLQGYMFGAPSAFPA